MINNQNDWDAATRNGVRCEIGDRCYRKECSEAGTCRPPCPICGRDTMLRAIGCYRCIAEGKQP